MDEWLTDKAKQLVMKEALSINALRACVCIYILGPVAQSRIKLI